MKKYTRSETFRADVFKSLGYFFASIAGLAIIRLIIFNQELPTYFSLKGCLVVFFFILGYLCIIKAFTIHERLDTIEEKGEAKWN
jgi:uncharacterized membrane-anchored protein YitT (DUF2179 family)